MKTVVVNGEVFTSGFMVGIPRYSIEILRELDKMDLPYDIELVLPREIDLGVRFNKIKTVIYKPGLMKFGKFGREYWRETAFTKYANSKDTIVLDICMMLQRKRNDITFIYDCQPEKFSTNYLTKPYSRFVQKVRLNLRRKAAVNAKLIVTDSYDARKDISEIFGVSEDKIKVVYCGWQHFGRVTADESVFTDIEGINRGEYFFSLGSRYKHKNMDWVFAAARQNPKYKFVVTGHNTLADYSKDIESQAPENVIFTGFLSDEKVKALMAHCKAFIQPSLSEGFGMPPLEAVSAGAKDIIVSNVTALPEVYGECAHYIDPLNYENIDIDEILATEVTDPSILLDKYSWEKSAMQIKDLIDSFEKG